MALQSSGPLKISEIESEFGGTPPTSISEYYRGGGLVPVNTSTVNIPESGIIKFSDFYSLGVEYTITFYFNNVALAQNQPNPNTIRYDYASELTVDVDGIYNPLNGGTYSQYHGNITGGVSENHTYTFRAGDTVTIYFFGYVTEGTKEYGNYLVDTDSNNNSTAYNNWVTYNSGNSYSNTFTMPSENLSCTIDMGNYFD